jgi:hypothetical protein
VTSDSGTSPSRRTLVARRGLSKRPQYERRACVHVHRVAHTGPEPRRPPTSPKEGDLVTVDHGRFLLLGNSLAGDVEAKSDRHLTILVAVVNVQLATPAEFEPVTADQAKMVVAVQQAFE